MQTNRPIITARIITHVGGNRGTALNIIIENTGNRPAKNIQLVVAKTILESFFAENEVVENVWRAHIMRIFSKEGKIPILANGNFTSNSFGFLSDGNEQSTWKDRAKIQIEVVYADLENRTYRHWNPLLIASDDGFAGGAWKKEN